MTVTLDDVRAAAARIAGEVERTPMHRSRTLSEITEACVFVKFENLQFTASFKERGALNRLLLLTDEQRRHGVVAASAGNHAQALAYHAGRLGIPATIVMPERTPNVKITRTHEMGATVVVSGAGYDEAARRAAEIATTDGATIVHAFDDDAVVAGQGTVALEMLDTVPDLDVIVVPYGGGGLIAGIATAARGINPEVSIVGVRVEDPVATIAEGIAVKEPAARTAAIVDRLVDEVLTVSEAAIEEAIGLYLEIEKSVAEGAGAASLAALLDHRERFAGRSAGIVCSGGNIDLRVLASVIVRSLVRTGRLVHLRVVVDDVPGALGRLTTLIGDAGGNIVELEHRRDLLGVGLQRALVELVVEARDHDHVRELLACLRGDGIVAEIETSQP